MHSSFEAEKNKKAFTYTALICGVLLLLAFFISWPILAPAPPLLAQDLLEINLGNNEEGFGEEQPLIKGEMSPRQEQPAPQQQQAAATNDEPAKDIQPEDDAEEDAAPITKVIKPTPKATNIAKQPVSQPVKTTNTAPVIAPAPKPQKPKLTYNGPGNGSGNGATEDNGYRSQGNKPGASGDAGDPSGKPDSYGNTPGGRTGGPRVIGNRQITKYYFFTGDLDKATVYATVKVSPSGTGTFVGFGKNSTTRAQAYANAIVQYLRNVQFNKSPEESTVTVQFNFSVK